MYSGIGHQVLLGSVLGDGSLRLAQRGLNPSYSEGHSIKQKDYLMMKRKLLPFETKTFQYVGERKGKKHKGVTIYSKVQEELHYYHNLFYPNGKKIVKKEALDQLKSFGLLIWHLDDGYYSPCKSITFNTQGFTFKEHQMMKQYFEERWGLKTTIRKHGTKFTLFFGVSETQNLIKIFLGYKDKIPPNMLYKLGFDGKYSKQLKRYKAYNKAHSKEWYEKNKVKYLSKRRKRWRESYHSNEEFKNKWLKKTRDWHKKKYWGCPEWREKRLEVKKEYCQKNREHISERKKEYREKNREEVNRKGRIYWHKNKEQLNKKRRERYHKAKMI